MPHIEDKIIYHHSSGNIEIPVLLDESEKLIRNGSPLEFGKKYRCALIHNIKGEDGKAVQLFLSGNHPTKDGRSVYTGCDCQTLCTKATGDITNGIANCCEMDMSLVVPATLPSSD